MKILSIICLLTIQLVNASDWKVESVVTEPYTHSPKKGAIKITVKIRNISGKIQMVTESPYSSQKGYARAASYMLKNNETYKELLIRNPLSHFLTLNSACCHELNKMNVPPDSVISMVMIDNIKNAGKSLSLHFGNGDHQPISQNTFIDNIQISKPNKMENKAQ